MLRRYGNWQHVGCRAGSTQGKAHVKQIRPAKLLARRLSFRGFNSVSPLTSPVNACCGQHLYFVSLCCSSHAQHLSVAVMPCVVSWHTFHPALSTLCCTRLHCLPPMARHAEIAVHEAGRPPISSTASACNAGQLVAYVCCHLMCKVSFCMLPTC